MALVNRGDLRAHLEFLVDANPSQTNNTVLTETRLNDALQRAYQREVAEGKNHGSKKYFLDYYDDTWTSGSETLAIDYTNIGDQILELRDVTNDEPGAKLTVGDQKGLATIYWRDRNTLRWDPSGPSENKTIRFYFYADPEDLSSDNVEPTLIPTEFRQLLCWSAAVELREIMDEESPASFRKYLKDWRFQYWKHISRGRPYGDPESSMSIESERERFFY